jgi:hypothetical protein
MSNARTTAGRAAERIIYHLQGGDSAEVGKWRKMDESDLSSSVSQWIPIIDALTSIGWEEPKGSLVTRDEIAVALGVHIYSMAWSNKDPRPHDENIPFGEALFHYQNTVEGDSHNDGLAMIRKVAASSTFSQRSYLLTRLVPKVNGASKFDYGRFTDDLYRLQFDDYADNVIIRWMKDFYSNQRIAETQTNNNEKEEQE